VGPWALGRRLAIVFVGMVLAIFATGLLPISGALLVAGVGIAPALAVMFAVVSSSVKFSDTAEAYGWAGTGQLIGSALGSAIAGFWIDRIGGQGGLVVAAVFAFVGVVVGLVFHRWLPDLRGRDASPLPDTEPVPVQAS
jgi:MFS family permease